MALVGKNAHFDIGATKVEELANWEMPINTDMIDVTSFDSNGWREFLAGLKSWGGSVAGNFAINSPQQKSLLTSFLAGTLIVGTFVVSPTIKFSGNLLITDLSATAPVEGKVDIKVTFKGTGPVTPAIT